MRIACLHTAQSNIAVFNRAAVALGLAKNVLQHTVRSDLLADAERAGGLTAAIADATRAAILDAGKDADLVILNCSTLGPAIGGPSSTVPVMRSDQALAGLAARHQGSVVVLCAVETTLESTRRLFVQMAAGSQATIDCRLIDGAWGLFKAGQINTYHASIAAAAEDAYDNGAVCVVLAQASMADAALLVRNGPTPLTSPSSALAAALEMLGR